MNEKKREMHAFESSLASEVDSEVVPARITLVYESRDKRLCLFEDEDGHLTAVRSSRLA